MTAPIPATYMPLDQLTATKLNGDLQVTQKASFRPPRAKFARTASGSRVSGTQPVVLNFSTPAVYDNAYDSSTMANASGLGFVINIEGEYRVKARFGFDYLAAATSGFRYFGLYNTFGTFTAAAGNIGNPLTGVFADPAALAWDLGRFVNGAPTMLGIDFTTSLIPGNSLQFGICQNSANTLNYTFAPGCIWATIRRVA